MCYGAAADQHGLFIHREAMHRNSSLFIFHSSLFIKNNKSLAQNPRKDCAKKGQGCKNQTQLRGSTLIQRQKAALIAIDNGIIRSALAHGVGRLLRGGVAGIGCRDGFQPGAILLCCSLMMPSLPLQRITPYYIHIHFITGGNSLSSRFPFLLCKISTKKSRPVILTNRV